jgi:hypothetical protein
MHGPSAESYETSHQHPANRVLHAIGIPLIAGCSLAALLGPSVAVVPRRSALVGAAAGAALLFLGHAIEGNRPAVFSRRGAVLDSLRWWSGGAARVCRRTFGA